MAGPITSAITAYTNAGRMSASGAAASESAGGTGFADLLKQSVGDVTTALRQGEATSLQAVAGKPDLNQVTAAVNNAEVALQAVLAIRDKIISAYQDISRMPI